MTRPLEAAVDDPRRLPLIYVRGFAGGTSGIDKAVADPFYGFNEGSTHVRVGAHDQPLFHEFESPLLRLIRGEGYELLVEGCQETYLAEHAQVPADSVWVHRFYDRSSGSATQRPGAGSSSDRGVPATRWHIPLPGGAVPLVGDGARIRLVATPWTRAEPGPPSWAL
ncbi:hypothetical protein [Streptomyces sp. NPDC046859]|uniref:hypothetical protein n=1 Tax=Streptomyces sp. NPDC046859 TaxID=3155734 RepID=UPI0033F53CF7